MKKIFITISLNLLFCISLLGQDLGKAVKDDADSLWSLSSGKFKGTFGSPEIYKWKTVLKTDLLYDSKGAKVKLSFFEHPISKADFRFKSKRLQGMHLTLAKPTAIADKKTYHEYTSSLKEHIAELGKIGRPRVMKRKSRGGYRYTYLWKSKKYYISVKCSYSINSKNTFKPGKIKFVIFNRIPPAISIEKLEKPSEAAPKKAADSNIKTNDKGDRYLKVPMIKENSPKECLTVCAKRIFKYYKTVPRDRTWKRISENLILNAKSAKGLKRIFASIASECRCDVKKLAYTSSFDDFNSVIRFVREYNVQAAKLKKNRIDSFKDNSFKKLLAVMDEDVLVSARNNPDEIKNFKSKVCKEIDAEKPVLWVVFLGIVKEKPEPVSPSGGRVRLIVGYNPKTNEVIYSDNWGKEHALKKMSWEKAWAITLNALAVTVKK
jgi:hypothetical protein